MIKKQTLQTGGYTLLFLLITVCMLTNASFSLVYARNGLELWFQNMVPTLLPFMILSKTLVRMGLTDGFTTILYPVIKPIFRISRSACYVMIMGFMCGFPMGARCIDDLYSEGKLSLKEAEWLLAFCNNIGPVYFISFALPLIGCKGILPFVVGMYGLPLFYGLILRYTVYRSVPELEKNRIPQKQLKGLLGSLNEAVYASLQSIFMLGGYMILFNMLMLLPFLCLQEDFIYVAPLLEITGGLKLLGDSFPGYSLLLLPFGGLSCIAQTYSCVADTGLSMKTYMIHKLILTVFTAVYYLLCLRFLRLW